MDATPTLNQFKEIARWMYGHNFYYNIDQIYNFILNPISSKFNSIFYFYHYFFFKLCTFCAIWYHLNFGHWQKQRKAVVLFGVFLLHFMFHFVILSYRGLFNSYLQCFPTVFFSITGNS